MKKNHNEESASSDAHEICAKIRQESEAQARLILERAKAKAEDMRRAALRQSEEYRTRLAGETETRLRQVKEHLLSTIALEKKKIVLRNQSLLIGAVLASVEAQALAFRSAREYPVFLKNAIVEGAGVIDQEYLGVYYSSLDERLITPDFIRETTGFATHVHNRQFVFAFHVSDFKDMGVIVQSQDGCVVFDNRFMTRLKRMQDDEGLRLLGEVLGSDA